MKIFVAGATGVLGTPAVTELVAAGHDVTGVARRPASAARLRAIGVTPVAVDLFDRPALAAAVAGHDAVVNLATHIPPVKDIAKHEAWAENSRLRSEASANLVDAALAAGATVYVQESVAFLTEGGGDEWIDETAPLLDIDVTAPVRQAEANAARFAAAGGRGVVLRFGGFYGPTSGQTQLLMRGARRGVSLDVGDHDAYFPLIAVADAGAAVVAAVEEAPSGVYNVVDDEPMTRRQMVTVWSDVMGRRVRPLPPATAKVAGPAATFTRQSMRASNRRFRAVTHWQPRYPSIREGLPPVVDALGGPVPRLHAAARVSFWILLLTAVSLGLWAQFAPHSFFVSFPFGRGWVAADGPYNEHLVRDFGGLNLALAVMTAGALVLRRPSVSVTAALAWLAFAVPHVVYHASHLDHYDTGDAVGNVVGTASLVVLALVVLAFRRTVVARRPNASEDHRAQPAGPKLQPVAN
jgi:nucleoside-diphosphate-sugar epimerase